MYLLFYSVNNKVSWDSMRFHDYNTANLDSCKQILRELYREGDKVDWRLYNMKGYETKGFCTGGHLYDEDNFKNDYEDGTLNTDNWYVRPIQYDGDLSEYCYQVEKQV